MKNSKKKNAKNEKFTNMLGIAVSLIVIDPFQIRLLSLSCECIRVLRCMQLFSYICDGTDVQVD